MGTVHLAKLTGVAGFEKLCIVKTILPQMRDDPQFVERFHHEARVLVQLHHSNIAQVHDMGEVDGTLYMAIEYVAGVDLSRVESRVSQQQAVVPIPISLYLAQQVAEALGYAHRKAGNDGTPLGIVHRDVSPQNIMVSYEGEVKVIDLGLAKSAARSKYTQPRTVMGKLGYMSPEQAMAMPVDHRSDIFSTGIVVWELLTGRPLYEAGTTAEMVAKMGHPSIESPRAIRPEISSALEQIIMRALQVDPAARYARADEFARALNELAVREGLTVGAEEVGNFVRAMCPEEFAAERELQSKLLMMRQKAAPEAEPQPEWSEPEALNGTLVRSAQPAVVSGPPDPGRGRTVVRPQASPAARPAGVGSDPSRSKALLYGALGALALGALGLAVSLLGGKSEPPPVRVAVSPAGAGDEKAPAREGKKGEEPAKEKREPGVAEAPRTVPAKSETPRTVPARGEGPAPATNLPAKGARLALRGVIAVSSASAPGGQIVRILNQNTMPLTGCIVRLSSNRSAPVQLIRPNGEVRIKYSVFHPDAKPPDPDFQQGWSAVYCREGTGYFFTTWSTR